MAQLLRPLGIAFAALAFVLQAQTGNFLKDFVDKLAVSTVTVPLSDRVMQDELFRTTARIPAAPASLLAAALPSAGRILTTGSAGQRGAVITLLFEIARRRDGGALLKPYVPAILARLRDPTPGTAVFATYILFWLFPQPVEQVEPYLIDYVNDEQVDEKLRAGEIGTLVWYAANDPAAVSAITSFMEAKHGKEARAGAIQSIGLMLSDSHRYSPALVELIINAIRNDPETRSESIQALGRCGWKAFAAANPVLLEIAGDEREPSGVRDEAKAAIDEILHSPRN